MGRTGRACTLARLVAASFAASGVACDIRLDGTAGPDASVPFDAPAVDAEVDAPGDADAAPPRDATAVDAKLDATDDALSSFDAGNLPPTVYAHDDWVQFCAGMTGCGIFFTNGMSDCVSKEPGLGAVATFPDAMLQCVRQAGHDCGAVRTCLNNGDPSTTCSLAAPPSCQGTLYTRCDPANNGTRIAVDCTAFGMTCSSPSLGTAGCGFGECQNEQQHRCIGGMLTTCTGGRIVPTTDCRAFSSVTCVDAKDGGAATCQGNSNVCVGNETHCQGNLFLCFGGYEGAYGCPVRDPAFRCYTSGTTSYCALGQSCTMATNIDTCTGTTLNFCNAGALDTLDCAQRGFATCTAKGCSN